MKINLAYAPDDKYSTLALISMTSALENNKDNDVEIVILYSSLSDSTLNIFENLKKYPNCTLRYLKIEEDYFNGFPISSWVTVQTWFRTKIADLCPDLKRVLYLDCDTLILAPLNNLFELDLFDNLLAGVPDVWGTEAHIKRLKILDNLYFNAGVLLLNISQWRTDKIFEKLSQYAIINVNNLECSDQDVLNKIADNKKIKLEPRYDFMETWWDNYYTEYKNDDLVQYNKAKSNPVIIHFTGLKPNHYKCLNSFKAKWWEYAKKTSLYESLLNNYLSEEKTFRIACKKTTVLKFLFNKILWKISFSKSRKKYKNNAEDIQNILDNYKTIIKSNLKFKKTLETKNKVRMSN